VGYKKITKYILRFLFLQILLSYITIYYYDNFLIKEYPDANLLIINNLLEDKTRFYPFVSNDLLKIDIYISLFVFIFLIILYSTNFYTYVNELSFTYEKKYIDNFINIYLLWSASLMTFIVLLRFSVLSRGYLLLYTFIVPIILVIFRNSELISGILGRPVTSESYVSFNLNSQSVLNNLRIITYRKLVENINLKEFSEEKIIAKIDSLNKAGELNLVIINLGNNQISKLFEEYLIHLNKKILLISEQEIEFSNIFLKRTEFINETYLTYFNNDIQYGSKYIIKRSIDILVSAILLIVLMPILLIVYLFIISTESRPAIIQQDRVGLHGKVFKMYKFRTMKKNSHELRENYQELNKNSGPLFKIENDPRIYKGGLFLRKYSLDELPQLVNVIKGNMSLVGPRPLFNEDTKHFDKNYMRRLNVLPGISGL
jgi:lipopolysaccharide/colanic/teichoic acid biosynthesis glycosyltransferase